MKPWEKYQSSEQETSGPWSKYSKEPETKKPSPFTMPLELVASHSPFTPSEPIAPWKTTLSHLARPTLEAGGMMGGSLLGAGAGLPTGPGAILTGAAGGTLGYGIGKQSADYVDQLLGLRKPPSLKELAIQTPKDLATGAAYEAGGQIFGKLILEPVFKGGKWVFGKVAETAKGLFSKESMKQSAGKILMAHTSEGTIYAENAKQAAAIEKEIPGLKFTMGQRTADPSMIKLERTQMRKPGPAATTNAEQIASNNEALRNYYQKNFPGKEGVDDLSSKLQQTRTDLAGLESGTKRATIEKATSIGPTPPQETGSTLLGTIDKSKIPVKGAMSELESQIPDYQMKFGNTFKAVEDILSSKKISVGQRKAVERIQKDIEKVLEQGKSTHTAFGVRRTLNDEIDKAFSTGSDSTGAVLMKIKGGLESDLGEVAKLARTGKIAEHEGKIIYPDKLAEQYEQNVKTIATSKSIKDPDIETMTKEIGEIQQTPYMQVVHEPKRAFTDRLTRDYTRLTGKEVPYKTATDDIEHIKQLVERNKEIKKVLSQVEPGKDVASSMKAYNDFASKEYFGRFEKGAVKQATARGTQASGTAARIENLPGYFTSPSGSDDLIRAIGKTKAGEIMKGHYAYDLLKNTTGPEGTVITSKLSTWTSKNASQLEKYGIKGEFDSIAKAQSIAEDAAKLATEFERGAASRILSADPEKAIANAIKGNNAGKAATDLLRMVKGDRAATEGLKNAFADHIMAQVQTTAKDVAGNPIISNAALQRTMAKYAPAMKVLYRNEPSKLRALNSMKEAYEIAVRNKTSPIGGGSDTAENILTSLSNINLLSRTATIARGLWKTIGKYSGQQVDDLVTRAMFDPEYAETLVSAVKGTIKESDLGTVMNGKIIKLDEFKQRRIAAAISATIAGGRAIDKNRE